MSWGRIRGHEALVESFQRAVRRGKWGDAVKQLERALLEFPPGDSRVSQAHFFLGEAQFRHFAGAKLLEQADHLVFEFG